MINRMIQKKFLKEPRHSMFDTEYLFDRSMSYDLYRRVFDRTSDDDALLGKYMDVSVLPDDVAVEIVSYLSDFHIWFDFTCVPQIPRNEVETLLFEEAMAKMHWILEHSYSLCIWDGSEFHRGWCIIEYLISTHLKVRRSFFKSFSEKSFPKSGACSIEKNGGCTVNTD